MLSITPPGHQARVRGIEPLKRWFWRPTDVPTVCTRNRLPSAVDERSTTNGPLVYSSRGTVQ